VSGVMPRQEVKSRAMPVPNGFRQFSKRADDPAESVCGAVGRGVGGEREVDEAGAAGERPNRVADGQSTDDARRRGGTGSRHDGKHVDVQEWASACFLRGLVPRPSGTAVYGPVRTVVWDPWLAL
jgi:hypothetical protein